MLDVMKNELWHPIKEQVLYPLPVDDGAGGEFHDYITGANATRAGGTTLADPAAEYRNNFQRGSNDPRFPLMLRASGAVTNLLYALNADAPSFEGGTVGGWALSGGARVVVNDPAWHGSKALHCYGSGVGYGSFLDVTAITAAGSQYTFAAMISSLQSSIRVTMWDDVTGTIASGNAILANDGWKQSVVTGTFTAGSVSRKVWFYRINDPYDFYADAAILVAGATVPMFEEKECVATSCTLPTPFAAGEPVSFLCFVWTPWAGNDGVRHDILYGIRIAPTVDGIVVGKTIGNNLQVATYLAGVTKSMGMAVNAVNWPAGTMKVFAGSLAADNTQRLALNGTLAGVSAGAGARETFMPATIYMGSDLFVGNPLNGIILPYIYRGVAWDGAECVRMSTLKNIPARMRRTA